MTVIHVNGTKLQAASDAAQPGDTLALICHTKPVSVKSDGGAFTVQTVETDRWNVR